MNLPYTWFSQLKGVDRVWYIENIDFFSSLHSIVTLKNAIQMIRRKYSWKDRRKNWQEEVRQTVFMTIYKDII